MVETSGAPRGSRVGDVGEDTERRPGQRVWDEVERERRQGVRFWGEVGFWLRRYECGLGARSKWRETMSRPVASVRRWLVGSSLATGRLGFPASRARRWAGPVVFLVGGPPLPPAAPSHAPLGELGTYSISPASFLSVPSVPRTAAMSNYVFPRCPSSAWSRRWTS